MSGCSVVFRDTFVEQRSLDWMQVLYICLLGLGRGGQFFGKGCGRGVGVYLPTRVGEGCWAGVILASSRVKRREMAVVFSQLVHERSHKLVKMCSIKSFVSNIRHLGGIHCQLGCAIFRNGEARNI